MRCLIPFFIAFPWAACGTSSETSTCVPGASQACACTSGASGAQLCNQNREFDPCVCLGKDGADGGAVDDGSSDVGAPHTGIKRVFITSSVYPGDFSGSSPDTVCAKVAETASLGGQWKAWISTSNENAGSRIADVSPWYLVDKKTKVFATKNQLRDKPLASISQSETGGRVPRYAWTGTGSAGAVDTGYTCVDWSIGSGSQHGAAGDPDQPIFWSRSGYFSCDEKFGLYCFEQ
jgi:hypothetical protein